MLDLGMLHDKLPSEIERLHLCSANARIAADASKLVIDIESPNFQAILSLWSNGCADLDLLARGTSHGVSWHREFSNTESALRELRDVLQFLPDLPS